MVGGRNDPFVKKKRKTELQPDSLRSYSQAVGGLEALHPFQCTLSGPRMSKKHLSIISLAKEILVYKIRKESSVLELGGQVLEQG